MTIEVVLNINGTDRKVNVDPDMPLLYAIRNEVGLNNPHFGCGLAQCGACTVHLEGQPIRSCVTPVSVVGNGKIVTLAGLGTPEKPHPLQTAYVEEQVPRTQNAASVKPSSRSLINRPDPGWSADLLPRRAQVSLRSVRLRQQSPMRSLIATGVRIRRVPFSPDRVKGALSRRRERRLKPSPTELNGLTDPRLGNNAAWVLLVVRDVATAYACTDY